MTDIERFNLFWLCHAMTAPSKTDEFYYYDGQTRRFFTLNAAFLFDMVDLPIKDADLVERLAAIDTPASDIVEIPRLNLQDIIAIQLLFLSEFPGVIHKEE